MKDNNGPSHKKISMDYSEVKRLLDTGDYTMPETQDDKIQKLQKQVQDLQEQNKTILEHLVELSQVIASQLK